MPRPSGTDRASRQARTRRRRLGLLPRRPIPAFLQLVGPAADGAVFFAGSLLFTGAAALQWLETINAHRGPAPTADRRRRLLSFEPRRVDWWSAGVQLLGTTLESAIVSVNLLGCLAFGVSAVTAFVVPSTAARSAWPW